MIMYQCWYPVTLWTCHVEARSLYKAMHVINSYNYHALITLQISRKYHQAYHQSLRYSHSCCFLPLQCHCFLYRDCNVYTEYEIMDIFGNRFQMHPKVILSTGICVIYGYNYGYVIPGWYNKYHQSFHHSIRALHWWCMLHSILIYHLNKRFET